MAFCRLNQAESAQDSLRRAERVAAQACRPEDASGPQIVDQLVAGAISCAAIKQAEQRVSRMLEKRGLTAADSARSLAVRFGREPKLQ
jgi:hypothetical protein